MLPVHDYSLVLASTDVNLKYIRLTKKSIQFCRFAASNFKKPFKYSMKYQSESTSMHLQVIYAWAVE
jgi:hypothetical protein